MGGGDALTQLDNVTIQPNPTTGKFQLTGVPNGDYSYEVIDLNGRVIRSESKITSTSTDVVISDVENGVYMVRVFNNQSEKMMRVIKH